LKIEIPNIHSLATLLGYFYDMLARAWVLGVDIRSIFKPALKCLFSELHNQSAMLKRVKTAQKRLHHRLSSHTLAHN
jgi:hypothetical protein